MNRSGQLPNLDKLFKDEEEQDFTPHGGYVTRQII